MEENAPEEQVQPQPQDRLNQAIIRGVPEIYFNGFVNGMGIGDVITTLERNGKPVAILNMSYTVAKTFAQSLTEAISNLERDSGNSIMTTHDIQAAYEKGKTG